MPNKTGPSHVRDIKVYRFPVADDPPGRLFAPISATRRSQCKRGSGTAKLTHRLL
jgi:hypothetical protein